jgi:hypothetical protein
MCVVSVPHSKEKPYELNNVQINNDTELNGKIANLLPEINSSNKLFLYHMPCRLLPLSINASINYLSTNYALL